MATAAAVKDPFSSVVIAFIFTDVIFRIVVLVIGGAHNVIGRLVGHKESPVLLFVIVFVPFPRLMPLLDVGFVLQVKIALFRAAFFDGMAFPFAVAANNGFNG
jgi:hypothetical protein